VRFITNLHPIVLICYLAVVLGIVMFTTNPILIGLALLGAVLFAIGGEGFIAMRKTFLFAGLLIILVTLTNPLFIHNGVTELFFLFGRVVTLESLCYGVYAGVMLASIVLWFRAYSFVMTSDKFLYLFGRPFPRLSLVLSMAMRFIPMFIIQLKAINQVQKTMGIYSGKSIIDRFLAGSRVFSSILTWSLENAIGTAESMNARGYGLPFRSSFSMFRFTKRDAIILALIATLTTLTAIGAINGDLYFYYYPAISSFKSTPLFFISTTAAATIMLLPAVMQIAERRLWKSYVSKI